MNAAQTQLFWRAWAAVVRAHGWRGSGAALLAARQACWVSPELDAAVYQPLWRLALELAARDGRAVTPDDLRHASHFIAIGSPTSSKRLTNAELDRVLALFRLLAAPDNIANLQAWQDLDAGERRRHLFVIRQSAPAYVAAIARDKFGSADLDALSLERLRHLSLTLRQRARARSQRLAAATPITTESCPA